MHNSESVLANEMFKRLRNFEIQTDHQILVLVIINKKEKNRKETQEPVELRTLPSQ